MLGEPLFASPRYSVDCPEEEDQVLLQGPGVPSGLVIGTAEYSQVPAIAIDPDERWCVMVGWGVIVYRLSPPWAPYQQDPPRDFPARYGHRHGWGLPVVHATDQWWEYRRSEPSILELDAVAHVGGERFEASALQPSPDEPTRWVILAESRLVRPLDWPSSG